ncbi:MAG: hypothetical protein V2J02_14505 [Pseudomonadales bacterium]|nr:hypothetical protein [Pseudomonadales bacterium]
MIARGALLLLLVLLATSAVPAAPASEVTPALAGLWYLDPERSDRADRRIRSALEDVSRDLRPRAAPGRPRPAPSLPGLLRPLRIPEARVELRVTDVAVSFRLDEGPPQVLYTDGRPSVVDARNPGVSFAAWEDGALWVERTSDRGTRVVERWALEPEGLRADYEVRNGLLEDPLSFTLRFADRPPGEEAAAP